DIGGVVDSYNGNNAGGISGANSVFFGAHSPVTVSENVTSNAQIVIVTGDTAAAGDNLTIVSGSHLSATAPAGSPIPGLQNAHKYTIHIVSGNLIQLLDNGVTIDLGTVLAGNLSKSHYLTPLSPFTSGANVNVASLAQFISLQFTGANANAGGDTIDVGPLSGLVEGEAVLYTTAGTI